MAKTATTTTTEASSSSSSAGAVKASTGRARKPSKASDTTAVATTSVPEAVPVSKGKKQKSAPAAVEAPPSISVPETLTTEKSKRRKNTAAAGSTPSAPVPAGRRKKQRKEKTYRISPYILHCMRQRPLLDILNKGVDKTKGRQTFIECGNQLGEQWRALSPEAKAKLSEEAKAISEKAKAEALASKA